MFGLPCTRRCPIFRCLFGRASINFPYAKPRHRKGDCSLPASRGRIALDRQAERRADPAQGRYFPHPVQHGVGWFCMLLGILGVVFGRPKMDGAFWLALCFHWPVLDVWKVYLGCQAQGQKTVYGLSHQRLFVLREGAQKTISSFRIKDLPQAQLQISLDGRGSIRFGFWANFFPKISGYSVLSTHRLNWNPLKTRKGFSSA